MSKPGGDPSCGTSSGDALRRPERHPACRRREARPGSCTERENLHGDVKGKGTSGSNREAESTDAPLRGGLPCSSVEAAVMAAERRGQGSRRADTHNTQTEAGWSARCSGGGRCRKGEALFERPIQRCASSRGGATGPDASSTLSTHSNSSIALSKKKRRFAVPCPSCRFGGPSVNPSCSNASAAGAPASVNTKMWSISYPIAGGVRAGVYFKRFRSCPTWPAEVPRRRVVP